MSNSNTEHPAFGQQIVYICLQSFFLPKDRLPDTWNLSVLISVADDKDLLVQNISASLLFVH